MTQSPDLAALIGSRICHDLVNPLSAVCNGVELLELSGVAPSEEMSLIRDSLANATARIQLFRFAFGPASDAFVAEAEMLKLLGTLSKGTRHCFNWNAGTAPRSAVRRMLLAMLCAETMTPLGGDITIASNQTEWTVTATGRRIAIPTEAEAVLNGEQFDLPPAQVHFNVLAASGPIEFEFNDTSLTLKG
ncbi:hypothetical protein BVC71_05195 [Marivivens niveibacter]|uniref:Histidine phosphotransferase ChpT C-terminal domain-containing protein n=1 Tax=Marivivens niveibacter TaxID=1930667 RepID=A0A251X3B2_9RHOB|nr:histidine phosphotransferase family protein [Marivivens niveibacter]OUD10868.1 hypothetical protein BVC71_05195 [Marivivens niveibacter]